MTYNKSGVLLKKHELANNGEDGSQYCVWRNDSVILKYIDYEELQVDVIIDSITKEESYEEYFEIYKSESQWIIDDFFNFKTVLVEKDTTYVKRY